MDFRFRENWNDWNTTNKECNFFKRNRRKREEMLKAHVPAQKAKVINLAMLCRE